MNRSLNSDPPYSNVFPWCPLPQIVRTFYKKSREMYIVYNCVVGGNVFKGLYTGKSA